MERRYLVGNKIDLSDNRQVDEDVGRRVKTKISIYSSLFLLNLVCKSK